MSRDASAEGKASFARLPLHTVSAVVRNYEYPASVRRLETGGARFEIGDSEANNLRKLALGRVDAVVAMVDELKTADYLLKAAGVGEPVELAFLGESQGTTVGFSLAHPRGAAARVAFDGGMELFRKDGSLDRIIAAWKRKL